MKRIKSLIIQAVTSAPILMFSLSAFAGGGGGTTAPEPAFLTMCAIVAGTELSRRAISKRRNKD